MKNVLFLICFTSVIQIISSQEIEMTLGFLGYQFEQNGEKINLKEVIKATESNPEANLIIKQGKKIKTVVDILSVVGGGLIGIPLGQSITGGDPNWTLAYIGGGITLVAIPFSLGSFNKINKGIDKYNLSLKTASLKSHFKPEFHLITTSNGLGITMQF